jgi:hypothetical protein
MHADISSISRTADGLPAATMEGHALVGHPVQAEEQMSRPVRALALMADGQREARGTRHEAREDRKYHAIDCV